MRQGLIVLLNGTSSSGKTSISNELINQKEILFHHLSLDEFFDNYNDFVNNKLIGTSPKEIDHQVVSQIVDDSVFSVYHSTVKLFSEMGLNVIADTVMDSDKRFNECLDMFADQSVLFVGVQCSKEELARREQKRGDRNIGLADFQFDQIYRFDEYDLKVNTEALNPAECAKEILNFIQSGQDYSVFNKLNKRNVNKYE
ncbi:chloramphenicol phosphotransferase CPT family protein [Paenibacillus bovis]|uniref:Chemotaxis protein n=1 Tax=Paenibacillus bovis TaxID=1616788 RepID=A0A172ZL21_9BACL|nr:AAA family ATPase [Paenibacillus bovis]ANF97840.1 chemotaxis protein [Paenibacillus bovis]